MFMKEYHWKLKIHSIGSKVFFSGFSITITATDEIALGFRAVATAEKRIIVPSFYVTNLNKQFNKK